MGGIDFWRIVFGNLKMADGRDRGRDYRLLLICDDA
jgi:hypothetical protein